MYESKIIDSLSWNRYKEDLLNGVENGRSADEDLKVVFGVKDRELKQMYWELLKENKLVLKDSKIAWKIDEQKFHNFESVKLPI